MHKIKQTVIFLILTFAIIIFLLFNIIKSNKDHSLSQTYFYLGTVINITLFDTADESHLTNISKIINQLENTISRNIEDSEVASINQLKKDTPLVISDDTFQLIEKSLTVSALSKGYFDITINPLVALWGIGTEAQAVPNSEAIKRVLTRVNYKNILLDKSQNSITLLEDNLSIDLGAIGKGYVADQIVDYLNQNNIHRALINLGGNVFAVGDSDKNTPWKIGIQHPDFDKSGSIVSLQVTNQSVVTSGIYERYFEADGKIYHHILDPFTGYPIDNNILSISIISNDSIDGDALSTSMFALGKDKALEIISTMDNVETLIVTKDKTIYITQGLEGAYVLFDPDYTVTIY